MIKDSDTLITSAFALPQGNVYFFGFKEEPLKAVLVTESGLRILSKPDILLFSKEGYLIEDEWIGRDVRDLIIFKEMEKMQEDFKILNDHIIHREEILNDPFLYL